MEMKLEAIMISCPERASVRQQTLANLAATDWREAATVIVDDGSGPDRIQRIDATWRRALAAAAVSTADLILLMEDDLDFNRRLRANLADWPRLERVEGKHPFFASLYDPGFYAVHDRPKDRYAVVDPHGCWGAQALLVSRVLAGYFIAHWDEEWGEPDMRMPRLASRFVPIYYHRPSLVDHIGRVSTWGGQPHQAIDFDPRWRSDAES
jgi:hypothetical protein